MDENLLLALPSNGGDGLAETRSEHFGRASHFTLVEVVDGQVGEVRTIANLPHIEGGCRRPVDMLSENGVTAAIVVGLGSGPFRGFAEHGIPVYADRESKTVGEAVDRLLEGSLAPVDSSTCHHH